MSNLDDARQDLGKYNELFQTAGGHGIDCVPMGAKQSTALGDMRIQAPLLNQSALLQPSATSAVVYANAFSIAQEIATVSTVVNEAKDGECWHENLRGYEVTERVPLGRNQDFCLALDDEKDLSEMPELELVVIDPVAEITRLPDTTDVAKSRESTHVDKMLARAHPVALELPHESVATVSRQPTLFRTSDSHLEVMRRGTQEVFSPGKLSRTDSRLTQCINILYQA
jgi:hypothetical protein